MLKSDLRGIDLNLLVALDALLDERSVTRAAARIAMSQPAMSRALGRLRALFGDALLVGGRAGYVLSPRAEEIRPILRRTLTGVSEMLEARPFDPAVATGAVRLLMADLESAVLAPRLLGRFAAEAPALGLEVVAPGASLFEALERDEVDAIVGAVDDAPAIVRRRALYRDRLVTLMRPGHPAARAELTLEEYLDLGHIVVSITGVGPAPVDVKLASRGRQRRVTARVPSFLAAVEIAVQSDLIMTLPMSLAQTVTGMERLVALPPPLDLGGLTMTLFWHARRDRDPQHVWLRRAIVEAAKGIGATERV